ncbi:MAG: sodium/glutamate symporter [Rubrivivax sp.]|nr:sodium/glutamate symporter [Rubrivivax sp.]
MTLQLTGAWTLVIALLTILLGRGLNRWIAPLERSNIPPAVSAGLLLSLVLSGLRAGGWLDVKFDNGPRDVLLLVFFASLGFGAHLGRLLAAGKDTLIICLAVLLAILGQNAVGVGVARLFGEPGTLGLFMGSLAYLGGHGTATAWSGTEEGAAVAGAFEVGIGSATLGLVLGALVASPLSVWLAGRGTAGGGATTTADTAEAGARPVHEPVLSSDRWLLPLAALILCLATGPLLVGWAASAGLKMPGFLAALLIGVLLTNLADAARRPFDTDVTDLVGSIALRIFLAIAMLSLDWLQLIDKLPLLLTAAIVQALVTAFIGVAVVFTLMGRGREGAAAAGGFVGFGLGAMPVGLAVVRRFNARLGATPRALLAITLAASLFPDTVNALILTALFRWLGGA